jgi:hypothetical protein
VESKKIVICAKCEQPITWGEGWVYVCFKIPGKQGYHCFHRRFPGGDCWEAYVRDSRHA